MSGSYFDQLQDGKGRIRWINTDKAMHSSHHDEQGNVPYPTKPKCLLGCYLPVTDGDMHMFQGRQVYYHADCLATAVKKYTSNSQETGQETPMQIGKARQHKALDRFKYNPPTRQEIFRLLRNVLR